jgi:DNA-binding HxlR family transcriptional regulator
MRSYGQYCPVARASEVLAQRWTPIIVRDLLVGPTTFNRLADGAPGLSRSLLTTRLRELERLGLVERTSDLESGAGHYGLTEPGRALASVIDALGEWGDRWLDVTPQQAEPGYVLNSWVSTYLATEALPDRRVVVRFSFRDQPKVKVLWVLFDGDDTEVCRRQPGFEEDLVVDAESVALAEWHLGQVEWPDAVRAGRIAVSGDRRLARLLPSWNRRSQWAAKHRGR